MTGFQRKYLRGLAHSLEPVVQVGQNGVCDAVVEQIQAQLLSHELIKVKMHEPSDKKAMAAELARESGAELCGLIGHVAILYRPHPEEPTIKLPKQGG
jgi:RNA-binding protein